MNKNSKNDLEPIIWKYIYATKHGIDVEEVDQKLHIDEQKTETVVNKKSTNNANNKFHNIVSNVGKKPAKDNLAETINFEKIKELTEKKDHPEFYNYYKETFRNYDQTLEENTFDSDEFNLNEENFDLEEPEKTIESYQPDLTEENDAAFHQNNNYFENDSNDGEDFDENYDKHKSNDENIKFYQEMIDDIDDVINTKNKKSSLKLVILTLGIYSFIQKQKNKKNIKKSKKDLIQKINDLDQKLKQGNKNEMNINN